MHVDYTEIRPWLIVSYIIIHSPLIDLFSCDFLSVFSLERCTLLHEFFVLYICKRIIHIYIYIICTIDITVSNDFHLYCMTRHQVSTHYKTYITLCILLYYLLSATTQSRYNARAMKILTSRITITLCILRAQFIYISLYKQNIAFYRCTIIIHNRLYPCTMLRKYVYMNIYYNIKYCIRSAVSSRCFTI